jgi:RimJ/RimL family protein N-acetyltransferase
VRLHTFGDNLRAQAAFKKVGFVEVSRSIGASGRIDVHMIFARGAWEGAAHSSGGGAGVAK